MNKLNVILLYTFKPSPVIKQTMIINPFADICKKQGPTDLIQITLTPAYTIMNTEIASTPPHTCRDTSRCDLHSPVATKTALPSLCIDQWTDLCTEACMTWDTLSDEDKKIILCYHHPSQEPNKRLIAQYHSIECDLEVVPECFNTMCTYGISVNAHSSRPALDDSTVSTDNTTLSTAPSNKKNTGHLPPGYPRRMLSSKYSVNMTNIRYHVSLHDNTRKTRALIDRGANGGIGGSDVRKLHDIAGTHVDITSINSHQGTDVPLAVCTGVMKTTRGDVVGIFNNYAYMGHAKTIHSAPQFDFSGHTVDDKSCKVGGLQRITFKNGYIIPIMITNGLPYISMHPPSTDHELTTLPQEIMTSPSPWDPSILDDDYNTDDDDFFDSFLEYPDITFHAHLDEYGDYHDVQQYNEQYIVSQTCSSHTRFLPSADPEETLIMPLNTIPLLEYFTFNHGVTHRPIDFERLRPNFLFQSDEVIRKTFQHSTQMARIPMSSHLRTWYKAPNPALNVPCPHEDLLSDCIYSDIPAIDGGKTCAQVFFGRRTRVGDAYKMKSKSEFPNTLQCNIRDHGAPDRLLTDSTTYETSKRVNVILNDLHIGAWQSEPHKQHQNPCERRLQGVKRVSNDIMNHTGCYASCWFLVLTYVLFVMNLTASESLGWSIPLQLLTGNTVDISILLRFPFWHKVYAQREDATYPGTTSEQLCYMVGFADHVRHALTYKLLTVDTQKISIYRSSIWSAEDPSTANVHAAPVNGESLKQHIKSKYDKLHEVSTLTDELPIDVKGRSITIPQEDGGRLSARIVDVEDDPKLSSPIHDKKYMDSLSPQERKDVLMKHTQFRIQYYECSNNEDIISYQQIMDYLDDDTRNERVWKFRCIVSHEGPLTKQKDKSSNGSAYNVMIEWENGETTTEPLSVIAIDDPITCAMYALENNLLDKPGWKRFSKMVRRQKKLFHEANQAKLRSFRTTPQYMYGIKIPRDFEHAVQLDLQNGNTLWQECTELEMQQLHQYRTFKDIGTGTLPPEGYKRIKVQLVYAVKHDGRHKARLCANGNLTDIPIDSVYSGVVSIRGLRMMIFLAELNKQELWARDIGNAYLEAYTLEKVCIKAGREFGHLAGHTLIISKALYGLRSSGLRWHEKFADCLRNERFRTIQGQK
jgi:hypothetical protein